MQDGEEVSVLRSPPIHFQHPSPKLVTRSSVERASEATQSDDEERYLEAILHEIEGRRRRQRDPRTDLMASKLKSCGRIGTREPNPYPAHAWADVGLQRCASEATASGSTL